MTDPSLPAATQILLTSAGRAWSGLDADFLHVAPGLSHAPGSELHGVGIHFGPPVKATCQCDGRRMPRVQKPGDIDIVPAGVAGSWEDEGDCRILRLSLRPAFVQQVAAELGWVGGRAELQPRLQVRDTRIEAIGWAIKADLEAETPSDPLYIDLLGHALAVRLIEVADGSVPPPQDRNERKLSARQLRILTDFIEGNLEQNLHLADLAAVIGVSVTRLKTLFRNSMGVSVHQYVIRRRVEYARVLLTTTALPASEIALTAGFADQSHMASTMRRVLGLSPRDILRQASKFGPNLPKLA